MGTCVVFQWARAVLSQQFLSLIPSDVDRAALLAEVTTELHLTADLTTDVSCPALQGHWEDILHAQIKLIELLTKWQEEKSAKKLNSPSVLNTTSDENTRHNSCKLEETILNDNVSVQSVDVSSDDFLLSNSSPHKQANFQNSSEQVRKQRCSKNETEKGVKSSQDIHSVYVFSNDCTRLDLIPSIECTVPSVTQSSLSTQNNTEKISVAVDPSTSSQLILVTASSVIDQKIKNEAVESEQKEELYMNIVLATRKDNSTSSKQIDNKNDDIVQVQTRSRENPLDKLCQLLKIDEEDTVPDTMDKKCDESERRRRYEENMPYKYFCSSCSFKTKRENQFLKHSKLHEKHRMIYHCHHCPFSTIRISTLRRHQLQHNEGRLMNCPKCPYKTDSSKFLTKHIQTKHSMDKPTLRCCQCDFAAGSLRELKKHRHLHSPVKPKMFWNCSLCSYKTQNKGHLQRHTNDVHELIRPYLCHHCGKSFKRHDTLKQHKMIHGEVGPVYTCSQCNKVCRSSTQLKEHLTVHTTQRPFLCELCGATFKTRSNQCKHIKMMHSAVKLFPCSFCKRTFSSKSTMMRHQKIHREKESSTDVDPSTPKTCIVNKMCSTSTSSELINENVNRGNHD